MKLKPPENPESTHPHLYEYIHMQKYVPCWFVNMLSSLAVGTRDRNIKMKINGTKISKFSGNKLI